MNPPNDVDALGIRRANGDDVPAILDVLQSALGWPGGLGGAEFFHWKHFESPFGASPMWIAMDGDRVVGLRAFLRWEFDNEVGQRVRAARAVDTATAPEYQGQGIFKRLTLGTLDELRALGVQFVFNTPNARSLPGYLKMGWSKVGRLPAAVMLGRARSALLLPTARRPASRSSLDTSAGEPACDVLSDHTGIAQLLSALRPGRGLATASSPEQLSWRYGFQPLHYRVMLRGSSPYDGLIVFRLRRRGRAIEAAICDVRVPESDAAVTRALLRRVARETQANYLLRLVSQREEWDGSVRIPGAGPILACRRLDGEPVTGVGNWELTLGDIELL